MMSTGRWRRASTATEHCCGRVTPDGSSRRLLDGVVARIALRQWHFRPQDLSYRCGCSIRSCGFFTARSLSRPIWRARCARPATAPCLARGVFWGRGGVGGSELGVGMGFNPNPKNINTHPHTRTVKNTLALHRRLPRPGIAQPGGPRRDVLRPADPRRRHPLTVPP